MAELPWGALLTFLGLVIGVALLAMDERNRRKFVTRDEIYNRKGEVKFCTTDDVNGMAKRMDRSLEELSRITERNASLFVMLEDRLGDLEAKAALLDERQQQQWSRIAESMATSARTVDAVVQRLERMAERQEQHALELARSLRNPPKGGGAG